MRPNGLAELAGHEGRVAPVEVVVKELGPARKVGRVEEKHVHGFVGAGLARPCRRSTRLSPVPCCELCSAHVGGTEHVLCVWGRGTHLAQLTSAELVEHARKLPSRKTAPTGLEAGFEAGIRADVRAPKRAAGLKGPRRPASHLDACGRASNGA